MNNISIIIITYNSSELVEKLLRSIILNKRYINEVFVIENNSPDKKTTQSICTKYKKYLNLKFIMRKSNHGFGKSCNYGAKKTSSKNILFINPDTELQPDSLEILLKHMYLENADIIGGKILNKNKELQETAVRSPNLKVGLFEFTNIGKIFNIRSGHKYFYYEDTDILNAKHDVTVDAVSGAYILITKECFNKLRGFDENIFMYLEDVDLGKRANDATMKVVYCPHSKILHIGGASSKNKHKIKHQAWFDSRKYYFNKHSNMITNAILQPIFTIEERLLKAITRII